MRKHRKKITGEDAFYHCMSRTVNGERLFGEREKEVLRKMIWRVAAFSGVQVLTYCVMENHFHVLLRVGQEAKEVTDTELLERYRVLYPRKYQQASLPALEAILARGGPEADGLRRRLFRRMGDVSEYMKTLKQRFTVYFNATHDRYGTLWAERFKSLLIEPERKAIRTVAAYIDLNPVRTGTVEDPKNYRYCGYAEAVAGSTTAREGLVWATEGLGVVAMAKDMAGKEPTESGSTGVKARMHRKVLDGYRMTLFGTAAGAREDDVVISREKAVRVVEQERGKLPLATLLRCRVRYFTDGLVLGSAEFLEKTGNHSKGRQNPKRRQIPIEENDGDALLVAKDLRGVILE